MYVPEIFQETDISYLFEFVKKVGFGMLVSSDEAFPVATHIPLEIEKNDSGGFLISGHLAKANSHWKLLQGGESVLAVFVGPDAYVSCSWYDHENVPTWDYVAVHVYGKPIIVTDRETLLLDLKKLVDRYEMQGGLPFRLESLSEEFIDTYIGEIVGIRINVEKFEGSFKLSQNRDRSNLTNIINKLEERGGHNNIEVAKLIKEKSRHKL